MAAVIENILSTPQWLDKSFLQSALREGLRRGSLDLNAYSINAATKPGDNYLSQMFRVSAKVVSRRKSAEDLSVLVKSMPKGEMAVKFCNEANFFEREMKMLSQTLPLFNKILEGINETKLCAELYCLQTEPENILILEDLCQSGFRSVNRIEYLDLQHTILVVERLACFHAASLVAIKNDPSLKTAYFESYWCNEKDYVGYSEKILGEALTSLPKCLDSWKIYPEVAEKFRKMDVKSCLEKLFASTARKENELNVINHGDPWTSNIMFKYTNQTPTDVRFVDFQLSCYNSPVYDLLYTISTSLRLDERANNVDDVLQAYYNKLSQTCQKLNYPLEMTYNELRSSFYERLYFGFFIFISLVPFMAVPSEDAADLNDYFDDEKTNSSAGMYQNEHYKKTVEKMLPFYIKHGFLD